eukprot:6583818-Alexandrium_andersonii.AAC.1
MVSKSVRHGPEVDAGPNRTLLGCAQGVSVPWRQPQRGVREGWRGGGPLGPSSAHTVLTRPPWGGPRSKSKAEGGPPRRAKSRMGHPTPGKAGRSTSRKP